MWARFGPWDGHQSLGRNVCGCAQLTLSLLICFVDCEDEGGITLWADCWPDRGNDGVMVGGRHDEVLFSIGVFFADYHGMKIYLLNEEMTQGH
jgi:hypothetical protein